MKVRNKNAKELKMDQDELDSKLRAMIEALDGFYGEYYTLDGRYSDIGQRYNEDLESSYEQFKHVRDNAKKSKVGDGPDTNWREVSSPYRYSNDD